jgi:hypothetical protein
MSKPVPGAKFLIAGLIGLTATTMPAVIPAGFGATANQTLTAVRVSSDQARTYAQS